MAGVSEPAGTGAAEGYTGGDAVLEALERGGVTVVFGIPSVHNLPIYDALARRRSVRAVTVRHEQSAAAAADGYARISGGVGVFITSTGPGAANAMGGLLEAFVSNSPVLHLTGQIETTYLGQRRGFIHEVPDQPAMLGALSKAVLRPGDAKEIGSVVAEGLRIATEPPFGPVSVELPIDLQYASVPAGARRGFDPLAGEGRQQPEGWRDAARRAAELIAAARRPVIWAGGGAVQSGAEGEVAELARRIGAGVLTSPNGRGVLSEDDPLCIGNLSWDPDVRELLAEADLLIGVGTRYQGPNTENWKLSLPERIVQIDVVPEVPARNYAAQVAVAGDARRVLAAVLEAIGSEPPTRPDPAWTARVGRARESARARLRSTLGGQLQLLDELSESLAPGTVVVKDSTIPAYTWGNRLLPVRATRTSMVPNGFAIGLGVPHAIGAALASGGEPVVLMVGDGGFMQSAGELATIAQEQLGVVVLLFNDGGYGILRNIQESQYGRRLGVDLGRPDFCELAEALGVGAERVDSAESFGRAVRGALRAGVPRLVEVDLEKLAPMTQPYIGTSRPPSDRPRGA